MDLLPTAAAPDRPDAVGPGAAPAQLRPPAEERWAAELETGNIYINNVFAIYISCKIKPAVKSLKIET